MPLGLKHIREAFRNRKHQYSLHALEEMDDDGVEDADVVHAVMKGAVVATLTDDPRGTRLVVRGPSADRELQIEIVCRFLPSSTLRIITVYAVED